MAFSDLKKRKHHVISDHNGKLFSAWNGFPANRDCARKYGGGWWYLYINEVCTANWNLNSICPHSGSNCTIQWAKLTPEADKNDPKMKIRPADFSYSPWGTRNFFFGRIFLLNNCLYEIIYQILIQYSVMFSGGLIKFFPIYQATWLILFEGNKTQNLFDRAEAWTGELHLTLLSVLDLKTTF